VEAFLSGLERALAEPKRYQRLMGAVRLDAGLVAGARRPARRRLSASNRGGNPFLGPLHKLLARSEPATALAHRVVFTEGELLQPCSSEFLEEDKQMASRTGFRPEVRDPVTAVQIPELVRHGHSLILARFPAYSPAPSERS
jgi:hypothetical protein